jgi:hypothetical protein
VTRVEQEVPSDTDGWFVALGIELWVTIRGGLTVRELCELPANLHGYGGLTNVAGGWFVEIANNVQHTRFSRLGFVLMGDV